jgi:hypothetical protein
VCYLSVLIGLASSCFSQKFAKGEIIGYLYIGEHDVPTSWHGSVDLHPALFHARAILFKESTYLFLLVKLRVFSTGSDRL